PLLDSLLWSYLLNHCFEVVVAFGVVMAFNISSLLVLQGFWYVIIFGAPLVLLELSFLVF
ncbi:24756_t:CDS:1, partial [Dentiscutata erythropus]